MGLADRDYMRERSSRKGGTGGKPPEKGPISHLHAILLGGCIGPLFWAFAMHRDRTIEVTVPAPAQNERQIQTVVASVPTEQTPTQTVPIQAVIPQLQAEQPPANEIVTVLNGARTQDLSHIAASTVEAKEGEFPSNGSVEWFVPLENGLPTGRMTIMDQDGTNAAKVVRIRQAESGIVIAQIYLHAGQGAYLDLPVGNYTLTVAKGERWYGKPLYFGPEGGYFSYLRILRVQPEGLIQTLLPANSSGTPMLPQPGRSF